MGDNIKKTNITKSKEALVQDMSEKALLAKPLPEWRPMLARECQVYVLGENYIGKRFDQINFRYLDEKEALQVVRNNVYALLRTKYFPHPTEETDDRCAKIINSFTTNLMTTLLKVSFQDDPDMTKVSFLPDGCIAFKNGVYDFVHAKWLFKYTILRMPQIGNKMFLYASDYLILWYFNFDFYPIEDLDVTTMSIKDLISLFKTMCEYKETRSMCFELMYNIAHDENDMFDESRFMHLCEILGYLCLQSFCQQFELLVGAGSNGKNSLFDGCFSYHIIPSITSNSLEDIENDRFITGTLINKSHNICLETQAGTHTSSQRLKQITGSMFQTIEQKGVQRFSGFINCKHLFSANDQEATKFSDTTTGFRRRINLFEIYYTWDPFKKFLKRGDYYDTTFSEDLHELKSNTINAIVFCYFAIVGMLHATDNFTHSFKFTLNDWKDSYNDIDVELKHAIERCGLVKLKNWINSHKPTDPEVMYLFYDLNGKKLQESDMMINFGYAGEDGLKELFNDEEAAISFFNDTDIYISTKTLRLICGYTNETSKFNAALKKIYKINASNFKSWYANINYVKCSIRRDKLMIVEAK